MRGKIIEFIMAVFLLLAVYMYSVGADAIAAHKDREAAWFVVIDAGHGGNDPGKVGINNVLEKDVNLKIAQKLKQLLEAQDIEVIMTRTEDKGLYDETDNNKKISDMKKRCEIVNDSGAHLMVSIHQNSYVSPGVKGAQTFYYSGSEQSRQAAGFIQKNLINTLDKSNGRTEKANNNYYMLLNVKCPAVIVECGFLSNPTETALLIEDSYQDSVAWAIHLGIMQYFASQ